MNIRPYKQGELDRLCSLYALINAVRSTGFKLTRLQTQAVADDIIENLSSGDLKDLMLNGAEHKEVMKLARRLNKVLHDVYDKQIEVMDRTDTKHPTLKPYFLIWNTNAVATAGSLFDFFQMRLTIIRYSTELTRNV